MKKYTIEVCLYEVETETEDSDLLLDSQVLPQHVTGDWPDLQEAVQAYKAVLEHVPSAYTVDLDADCLALLCARCWRGDE